MFTSLFIHRYSLWQWLQRWRPGASLPSDVTQRHPVLSWGFGGVVLGTALQLQQSALDGWLFYAVILVVSAILASFVASKVVAFSVWRGFLACLAVVGLTFALCGLRALVFASHAMPPELEGRDIQVLGTVSAMPQRNAGGARFRLQVESATADGQFVSLPPSIYLGWYGETANDPLVPELVAGQVWQLTVRLKAPHGNANPGGFDYELWLWEQGLQATGYVRSGKGKATGQGAQMQQMSWRYPVERVRQQVRDSVYASVSERRTAGVIAALLVGDQAAIERADWDIFRATGVAHLMSISGLHVTLFAWAAAWLLRFGWRQSTRLCMLFPAPLAAAWGGLGLAVAYAVFSGWGVPAQRTVLMLFVAVALRTSGAHWPWRHVWLAAMAVVLLWDPWALLSAGFWLGFVAVGVLFATDLEAKNAYGVSRNKHFRAMFREQAVVTLALTPLGLLLFGQVSLVGLLANLLAIPWVTLVVTPLSMAGVAWGGFWQAAAWGISAMGAVLNWLAAWPMAMIAMPTPPIWLAVAAVLGGALLAKRLPWAWRLLGLPLMLPVLLWQPGRPVDGQVELIAADVGQGTAVLVRTAHHSLLYDAGPRWGPETDAGHRVLLPLLRRLDEKLDTLVLSHRDTDHTGGAMAVLGMQPQATLLSSIEADHALQALRPVQRCEVGQRWHWDGVLFEVIHPQAADYATPAKSNALSCVLRISTSGSTAHTQGQKILLTGDIEAAQEAQLLAHEQGGGADLHADVLLVPHHGSRTSSTDAFVQAVSPRFALVQAGYRNRFGHPAPAVLERYQMQGIDLLDSSHCGAATWRSTEPMRVHCQRVVARRYWHHVPP